MGHAARLRFPKSLLLTLAVLASLGAAIGFIIYMANGIVASDLIGLPGREHDISVAQHRSGLGLLSCVLLQLSATGAFFGYLDRENGYVGPVFWAALLSLATSVGYGFAIVLGMRAFR